MALPALLFEGTLGDERRRLSLELDGNAEITTAFTAKKPAAYIVETWALKELRRFPDQVLDRGCKDPRKGLASYLVGKKKPSLIEANYQGIGQLQRGVRALLRNAAKKDDRNIYIIGVDPAIFAALTREIPSAGTLPDHPGSAFELQQNPSRRSQHLLRLLGDIEVDEQLERRYIGESVPLQLVRVLITQAAKTDNPVLILGESGTGKEIVAREIHKRSRQPGQFVAVNCAAIAKDLLESELFGYKRGAFTGAVSDRTGLWEWAKDGTLFLDEIADLTLDHQGKILRALQECLIRPVGGTEEISVQPRIIAATNRDLFAMVRNGDFRDDLYYRLRGFQIETPPLRDCRQDIPLLCQKFWQQITGQDGAVIPRDAQNVLARYHWPGNVRELKSVLRSAYSYFQTSNVSAEQLALVMYRDGPQIFSSRQTQTDAVQELECLRHLHRTANVLWACKNVLTNLGDSDQTGDSDLSEHLRRHLNELDVLCLHPALFNCETAFAALCRLKERLLEFHSRVSSASEGSLKSESPDLAAAAEDVLGTILKEAQTLGQS